MAIEDDDIRDREVWTSVSRHWYSKASDKAPTTVRLYHHLAILARPNALQQLFYYTKSLSFCVTTIPCKPICLVSLLLARAIADQAFKADFKSLADILERPNLGQVDSLPLSWAAGMEDKEIVPIHYPTYLDLWHRTLLVAGLRHDTQRPYSLRVGAGGRLSGSLEERVRNYVMGNTKDVFLKSYQPRRVTRDLVATAFGRGMAVDVADLFKSLRRSFLQRDPDAPLYPTEADIKALKSRQDLTDLRAAYRDAVARTSSDDKDAKCIAGKIGWSRLLICLTTYVMRPGAHITRWLGWHGS
ncbi:Uu.00g078330.m01.CDS01 [Anthostomella pinea]|uniref:Uu.00g078330.m01.CDS01 n=2 Tax=Anthostomella pinea TaxID=933095 RepID=A0AAI8YJ53_9PEZI|nr:Uu.00g078330.m01.CDS01 [Anthostomella pinea]